MGPHCGGSVTVQMPATRAPVVERAGEGGRPMPGNPNARPRNRSPWAVTAAGVVFSPPTPLNSPPPSPSPTARRHGPRTPEGPPPVSPAATGEHVPVTPPEKIELARAAAGGRNAS